MAYFQRAVSCDVEDCENQAKYQCLNCDDALCTNCKEKHEKRRPTHKFVLYSEREKRTCKRHTDNKNIFWCKTCSQACCAKCSIISHKGHDLDIMEDAICDKKARETQNLQGPFQECLTQWKTLLDQAKEMRTAYKHFIQNIDQELVAHTARIHEAVDKTLDKVRKELREISESQEMTLQTQEKKVNDKYEEFKRNIRQLEKLVLISDISLLEHKLDIADMKALPALSQQFPSYIPGRIDDQVISTMIGKYNISVQNIEKKNSSKVTRNKEPSQHTSASVTPLLSKPVVVSSFNPGYSNPYIACTTSSGLAWVATGEYCIQLMDRNGAISDTIHTDFEFNDVTVTPLGDVLFSDCDNKRIVSASKIETSWRITPLFSTQYDPYGICSLSNGDVVVTYFNDHRVIQYSSDGDIIHEIDPEMFSGPLKVAVNKVNEDIYICDENKLLVFGKNHRLRYEYEGSDSSSFDLSDVSTDTSGRVLVNDENNRVHVLDKDGRFLQYIEPTGLKAPRSIDVDSEGDAWIGEYKGQVKIVKYL